MRYGLVAAASTTWLAGAAVGAFARAAFVLAEANFTGIAIVRHRTLGQVATLVRLYHDASTARDRCRDQERD
jgi:hypothetical protein